MVSGSLTSLAFFCTQLVLHSVSPSLLSVSLLCLQLLSLFLHQLLSLSLHISSTMLTASKHRTLSSLLSSSPHSSHLHPTHFASPFFCSLDIMSFLGLVASRTLTPVLLASRASSTAGWQNAAALFPPTPLRVGVVSHMESVMVFTICQSRVSSAS